MSVRSRIARGIGFGALAVAHLGLITAGAPFVQPPVHASGGGIHNSEFRIQNSKRIRRNNEALLLLLLK